MSANPKAQLTDAMDEQTGHKLVFKNISVNIDRKPILHNINGVAFPGEILAIMGPSGAGKTTLLNCLAGRRDIDEGNLTLNSLPLTKSIRRKISYVLQSDTFFPDLTCWQTIWYMAQLRLAGSMTTEQRRCHIDKIIDALDLRKCLHTKVGSTAHRGLSGGEKKRTNIACELLTDPALMLLDEPTSGLDSATAYSLIRTLKDFAKKSGKMVVLTIHQPSNQIFHMFDKLLLLCDGQVAYFGDVDHCGPFFTTIDLRCPEHYDLADHILDKVKDTDEVKERIIQRAEHLRVKDSVERKTPTINQPTESSSSHPDLSPDSNDLLEGSESLEPNNAMQQHEKWPTSFTQQFVVLFKRNFRRSISVVLSKEELIIHIATAIFAGQLWFGVAQKEESLSDRQSLLYMMARFTASSCMAIALLSLPDERPILNKERLGGYYRLSSYYLAKIASHTCLVLPLNTGFITTIYWLSGTNYSFTVYIQMLLTVYLCGLISQGLGFLLGYLIADQAMAHITGITLMICMELPGGFFISNVPIWVSWLKKVSFMTLTYHSLVEIDLSNVDIRCARSESTFTSCVNAASTQNSTEIYIPQDQLIKSLTLRGEGWYFWHNLLILTGILVFNYAAAYIVLRLKKPVSTS